VGTGYGSTVFVGTTSVGLLLVFAEVGGTRVGDSVAGGDEQAVTKTVSSMIKVNSFEKVNRNIENPFAYKDL
jgi:hypothetical protein